LDEVWSDSVVGEEILTRAISELRRIFGDKAREPRFIETIRNHGYRLIEPPAPVGPIPIPLPVTSPATSPATSPVFSPAPEPAATISPEPTTATQKTGSKFSYSKHLLLPSVIVIVLILAVYSVRNMINSGLNTAGSINGFASAKPLTSFPGREWHPAFSADGTRVAFVWSDPDSPDGPATNIFVKQQNSETLLQLTDSPGWVAWPTWSPDGQTVAFVQGESGAGTLSLVSSLGGAIRHLHPVSSWVEGVDFAPDGKSLLFASRGEQSGKYGIYQLNLQDLQVQKLPLDDGQRAGDFQPRFAPDGASVAWVGVGLSGHSSLYWAALPDGPVRKVGGDLANLQGLAFAADGRHLIYSASPAGTFNLWRIALNGGQDQVPEFIPTPGAFAWNPSVARNSGDLVFEQVQVDQDIWQIRILEKDPWQLETSAFLKSTRWEYEADFSPDGNEVAFVSARSGSPEVWLADQDGKNLRKLTNLGSAGLTNLRWSPDGQKLAFNALQQGRSVVMIVTTRGAEPRILTLEGQSELFSSWSQDGNSLLYGSDLENGWELRRRNLNDEQSSPVTTKEVVSAVESSDGQFLFYTRPSQPGLWQQSLAEKVQIENGEQPELILDGLTIQDSHNWVLHGESIFWVLRTGGVPMLAVTDLTSGRVSLLTELSGMTGNGLAVSPDGLSILYPRTGKMEGDLMVLQGLE